MKKPLLLLALFLLASALWAQNRYALVIGNSKYPSADLVLPNTIKDSADISKALGNLGYSVVLKNDLKQRDMVREIDAFIDRLKSNANSEGFFWYAGHGMSINGENLLLPLDVETNTESMIKATSYSVTELTRQLTGARNKANVVVLDACRVPPRVGGVGRAYGDTSRVIKPVSIVPPDMVIMYSTSEGYEAKDGPANGNSPFAQAFLNNIMATVPIQTLMIRVARDTMSLTSQAQLPEYRGSMIRDENYTLNPVRVSPAPNPTPTSTPQPTPTPTPPPAPPVNPQPAPNMVRINGGTFTMGSPSNEGFHDDDEGPQHRVTVSSFYMGKYPVTQKEYQEVMGSNPSKFKGDNLPVESVSWFDAVNYCNRLSQKEGLTPAYTVNGENVTWNSSASGYRLPTEAEWEYACRAGTTTAYNTGANISDNTGWYLSNSGSTHPVGQKAANSWGLYDMHGNVFEWCWDWYGAYSSNAQTDPKGASSGSYRVNRGGSWNYYAQDLRSAYRDYDTPSVRRYFVGFRIVRNG